MSAVLKTAVGVPFALVVVQVHVGKVGGERVDPTAKRHRRLQKGVPHIQADAKARIIHPARDVREQRRVLLQHVFQQQLKIGGLA